MIKAVIFDSDGTIVDSEPVSFLSAKKSFQELYGVTITRKDMLPLIGTGISNVMRALARKHNHRINLHKILKQSKKNYLLLVRGRIRIFPGFLSLFGALRRAGLKTALATSGHKEKLYANMKAVQWNLRNFDVVLHGDMVKRNKPNPEIYIRARKKLEAKPSECVVIEDSLAGIIAAKRAGARVIAVTNSFPRKKLKRAGADLIVGGFREITLAAIQRLGR